MAETNRLTPRQEMLLRLIVKEHVETAGTVASRALVDRYDLTVSTATVRNEMARLEAVGLPAPAAHLGRPSAYR